MKYIVKVNETKYEVEIERADGQKAVAAPVTAAPVSSAPSGGQAVTAPMPGSINEIHVSVGQQVKRGDLLLILEAMKMENEILAEQDGTVTTISVAKGATVNTGDTLLTIK